MLESGGQCRTLKVCMNILSWLGTWGSLGVASLCFPALEFILWTQVAESTAVPVLAASWPPKPDAWRTLAGGMQSCAGGLLC